MNINVPVKYLRVNLDEIYNALLSYFQDTGGWEGLYKSGLYLKNFFNHHLQVPLIIDDKVFISLYNQGFIYNTSTEDLISYLPTSPDSFLNDFTDLHLRLGSLYVNSQNNKLLRCFTNGINLYNLDTPQYYSNSIPSLFSFFTLWGSQSGFVVNNKLLYTLEEYWNSGTKYRRLKIINPLNLQTISELSGLSVFTGVTSIPYIIKSPTVNYVLRDDTYYTFSGNIPGYSELLPGMIRLELDMYRCLWYSYDYALVGYYTGPQIITGDYDEMVALILYKITNNKPEILDYITFRRQRGISDRLAISYLKPFFSVGSTEYFLLDRGILLATKPAFQTYFFTPYWDITYREHIYGKVFTHNLASILRRNMYIWIENDKINYEYNIGLNLFSSNLNYQTIKMNSTLVYKSDNLSRSLTLIDISKFIE